MNGMVRPPNDGVHLETPQAQTVVKGDHAVNTLVLRQWQQRTTGILADPSALQVAQWRR